MRKVVVIETTESDERLRSVIAAALEAEPGTIETIQHYPLDGRFRADYLDAYNEVQSKIENDYEDKNFEARTIINIADSVAEDFSNDEDTNEFRDQLMEDAIYKALLN